MKTSSVMMPVLAFLAGAVGYYIRQLEILHVFDAVTGLPLRGSAVTYSLIALTVVFLVLIFLFSIYLAVKKRSPEGFSDAFETGQASYPIILSVIGLFWLMATIRYFAGIYTSGLMASVDLLFSSLSSLSAIATAVLAIDTYRSQEKKAALPLCILPALFMCFWLIVFYRQNASNPVLTSYAYTCLAIMFSALGFYFTCGYVFNKPAPGKTVFSCLAAVYFCIISLADHQTVGLRLVVISIIATNAVYCAKLIKNLQRKES